MGQRYDDQGEPYRANGYDLREEEIVIPADEDPEATDDEA